MEQLGLLPNKKTVLVVGGGDGVTGGAQVLNSELRNAVWDAFGLVNFVWW